MINITVLSDKENNIDYDTYVSRSLNVLNDSYRQRVSSDKDFVEYRHKCVQSTYKVN